MVLFGEKASYEIYTAGSEEPQIEPLSVTTVKHTESFLRKRCVKFIDEARFVVSSLRTPGNSTPPLKVHHLGQDGSAGDPISTIILPFLQKPSASRSVSVCANVLAPLSNPATEFSSGDMFLAGCTDGSVR